MTAANIFIIDINYLQFRIMKNQSRHQVEINKQRRATVSIRHFRNWQSVDARKPPKCNVKCKNKQKGGRQKISRK